MNDIFVFEFLTVGTDAIALFYTAVNGGGRLPLLGTLKGISFTKMLCIC